MSSNPIADLFGFIAGAFGVVANAVSPPPPPPPPKLVVAGKSLLAKDVNTAIAISQKIDFDGLQKAINDHFSNLTEDVTTIDDVASAVGHFFPAAMYVADVAEALLVFLKIGGALPPSSSGN